MLKYGLYIEIKTV